MELMPNGLFSATLQVETMVALRMDCIPMELMQRASCFIRLVRRAAKLQRGHMKTSKPAYIAFTNSNLGRLGNPVLA